MLVARGKGVPHWTLSVVPPTDGIPQNAGKVERSPIPSILSIPICCQVIPQHAEFWYNGIDSANQRVPGHGL